MVETEVVEVLAEAGFSEACAFAGFAWVEESAELPPWAA